MITKEKIIEWSKPHSKGNEGAKRTVIGNDLFDFSIVGGGRGLYGDFENDFEVAIIRKKDSTFLTTYFFPVNDDVVAYMEAEELVKSLNEILGENFQVR
jgi:hypothetical protein